MNNFWIGGTERLLFDLVTTLSVTHKVGIVTVLGSGPLESEFRKIPVQTYHASPMFFTYKTRWSKIFWLITSPVTFIRLVIFMIKVKPDVILTSLYHADVLGIFAAWLTGVPKRILIQHDVQKFSFPRKYLRFWLALNLTTYVVAISHTVREFLAIYWHIPQNKMTVIHNGVNINKFENAFKPSNEKEIVFGVIGRLESVKGHRFFLQALKILKQEGLEPKVILAGDGTLRKDLEEYAKKNLLQRVEFMGAVTDTSQFFKLIDILIVPSLEEGFGLVVLEGLAARKTIIASDIGAFRELIIHGKTGVLFKNKDAGDLADILKQFILQPRLIEEYCQNIEIWMREIGHKYDIKSSAAEYEKLF